MGTFIWVKFVFKFHLVYTRCKGLFVFYEQKGYKHVYNVSIMKIVIVEDEMQQQELLTSYVTKALEEKKIPFELKTYTNAESFIDEYEVGTSLVFMDIELPGMNGMEASRKLRELDGEAVLIFVTNMAQFAIQGYEVDATDFIVKPINYYSFSMKLDKALRILIKRNPSRTILLPFHGEEKAVLTKDILYVEVVNHDLFFHTVNAEYKVHASMKKAVESLQGLPFSRCHIGYLVNLAHVKEANKNEIILSNGVALSMPRTRRKEFLADLANYLSGGKV